MTRRPTTGPASLLTNSDFKTDDGNGWPAGWAHPAGVSWETEGDVRFLRFTASEPGKMLMVYRQLVMPQTLPPAMELHIRLRCEDVKVGEKSWFDARVLLQWKDANGKTLKPQPPAPNFHGSTKGWVDRSVYFSVPPRAHVLEIMPACSVSRAERWMSRSLRCCRQRPTSFLRLPP